MYVYFPYLFMWTEVEENNTTLILNVQIKNSVIFDPL